MKHINYFRYFILAVLMLPYSFIYSQSASGKEGGSSSKYFSSDGKFKISFPASPIRSSQMVETSSGQMELIMFTYEANTNESYLASYCDYPSSYVIDGNAGEILEAAKGGFISSMNMTVRKQEETSISGTPGIYAEADDGNMFVSYKVFLKGNRLYQVLYICLGQVPESVKSGFMKSLEFTN